ncbi:MAG TPA: GNAT family N-acetyltransferase [Gemmatimonadaceae bacterium]
MKIEVTEERASSLPEYATIPIAYEIRELLEVEPLSRSEPRLKSRPLANPVVKDYDVELGNDPLSWPRRFDVGRWGFLFARVDSALVGGAVIIVDAPDVDLLERRGDLALLWDIRVVPDMRRHGVGTALLAASERWARARGATVLKVETQNVNVPACRFYSHHGFELRAANPSAYSALPHETQFLWYKDLN